MSDRKIIYQFLPLVIVLIGFGIITIYSGNSQLAFQQLVFAIIGLLFLGVVSQVDYVIYKNFFWHFYILSLVLLVLIIFAGSEVRGATRWIELGVFRFQPSELVKPLLVVTFASFADMYELKKLTNFLKSFAILIPFVLLISRQPDLGSAIIIICIWIAINFAAGVKISYFAGLASIFTVAVPLIWQFLEKYQKDRLLSFFDPARDPLGTGYNVIQSTIAIGSGQLFGRGFGQGTQSHLQFLPEFSTDFIFATLAEELGLVGAGILLVLMFYLILTEFRFAANSKDRFGSLIVVGVMSGILSQVVINVGMNLGILPVAGVTLPLVSYGGSSLISTLIGLGMVLSVKRFSRSINI